MIKAVSVRFCPTSATTFCNYLANCHMSCLGISTFCSCLSKFLTTGLYYSPQYCLSGHPNKPCNVVTFKSVTLMLDCGLDMSSVSHFLPLPLVASHRLGSLSTWVPRDADSQLEGVRSWLNFGIISIYCC